MRRRLSIAAVWMAVLSGTAVGGVFTGAEFGPETSRPQAEAAQGADSSRAQTTWQRHKPARERPAGIQSLKRRQLEGLRESPSQTPAGRQSTSFGHPVRTDPLFDEVRPDWDQQHYERPEYARPVYETPDTEKPLLGLDPVRRPVADRPLYVLPNDNKPNNNLKFYAAPGYDRPTTPWPVPRGPNYVIRPEFAPAYDHPTYDHPYYDRPEYLGPTYEPQEFAPPQNRPPDYVAPPQ